MAIQFPKWMVYTVIDLCDGQHAVLNVPHRRVIHKGSKVECQKWIKRRKQK
jgi:hypothetical protein